MMSGRLTYRLLASASPEAREVALSVLEEDAHNQLWRAQIGPCLSQAGTARLLGISAKAVAKRADSGDLRSVPTPRDRTDVTGARRSVGGAEAVLELRAIPANGDFDDYWRFHLEHERHPVQESGYDGGIIPLAAQSLLERRTVLDATVDECRQPVWFLRHSRSERSLLRVRVR